MSKKIIFLSNVNGNFEKLADQLSKIVEKTGEYDIIFLIGRVFNKEKSFNEISKLEKIKTKFIVFDSSEVGAIMKHSYSLPFNYSENIIFLDRKGILTVDGLKIAYLSGFEEEKFLLENNANSAFDFTKAIYSGNAFNREDVNELIKLKDETEKNAKIDILLTHSVPSVIFQELLNSTESPIYGSLDNFNPENPAAKRIQTKEALEKFSSYSCSLIAKKFAPRYHVVSMDDFFYEKLNFFSWDDLENTNTNSNSNSRCTILSRFINLAFFPTELKRNPKEKSLYALAIKPINLMSQAEIEDAAKIENAPSIQCNIYKSIPDNIDLVFSTYKKYECRKLRFNKEEIYVGNLDRNLTYDDIYNFLSTFGEIAELKLNYSHKGYEKMGGRGKGQSKRSFAGNCFVKYKDLNVHDKLIAFSNQYSLRGRKIVFSEKVEKIQSIDDIEKTCWFCFRNPNIEKDLILFEFNNFYIAYPKGPIDNYHLIIAPKLHIPNYLAIPSDLYAELDLILKTLKKFYSDNELEFIIFEKNLPYNDEKAKHMILNMVGVKKDFAFEVFNKAFDFLNRNKLKYQSHPGEQWNLTDLKKENNSELYYHYLDIPVGLSTGKNEKRSKFVIVHEDRKSAKTGSKQDFSDFARIIVCDIIEKRENVNWKNCRINDDFLKLLRVKIPKYFK